MLLVLQIIKKILIIYTRLFQKISLKKCQHQYLFLVHTHKSYYLEHKLHTNVLTWHIDIQLNLNFEKL